MDARIINACSQTYFFGVKWDRPTSVADSEWIYFGSGNDLDLNVVEETVEQHLRTDTLLLDVGRHRSRQIGRKEFISEFRGMIAISGLILWDDQFRRVVEFGRIGVLRKGSRSTEQKL